MGARVKLLKTKSLLRFFSIGVISFLMMGNQSCNNQTAQTRTLKKTVQVQNLKANNIQIPGGGSFDFQSVINWQVLNQLSSDDNFVIQMQSSTVATSTTTSSSASTGSAPLETIVDPLADANVPVCLQDLPQVVIGGQINSFEVTGGGGINIGYSPTTVFTGLAGASLDVQVQDASMDMSLMAWSPYYDNLVIGSGEATSSDTQTSFNLDISFAGFTLNPSLFLQTPLAQVTQTGIQDALAALDANINTLATQQGRPLWEGQVETNTSSDGLVQINAGSIENLEVGDQFQIYNVHTVWDGAPCASNFTRETTTDQPVAIVQIMQAADLGVTYARAQIMSGTGVYINPGAVVRIYQLATTSTNSNSTTTPATTTQTVAGQ
jgi:hypothetical protein